MWMRLPSGRWMLLFSNEKVFWNEPRQGFAWSSWGATWGAIGSSCYVEARVALASALLFLVLLPNGTRSSRWCGLSLVCRRHTSVYGGFLKNFTITSSVSGCCLWSTGFRFVGRCRFFVTLRAQCLARQWIHVLSQFREVFWTNCQHFLQRSGLRS